MIFQHEHAEGKTGFGTFCLPHKENNLGWERRHKFTLKMSGLGKKAKAAASSKQLVIGVEGVKTIYKWTLEQDKPRLNEIKPKPLHERFAIQGDSTVEDNHFDGIDRGVPPKCGWWGFGKFDLNLYKVTFKDQETADKFEKKWGRKLKASEAPPFVNGNPEGTTVGMEGYPTFDDVNQELLVEDDGRSDYLRRFEYVYLPMHLGKKDISQLSAEDKKALQAEMESYRGGSGDTGITLEVLLTMRKLTLGLAGYGPRDNRGYLPSVLGETSAVAVNARGTSLVATTSVGVDLLGTKREAGFLGKPQSNVLVNGEGREGAVMASGHEGLRSSNMDGEVGPQVLGVTGEQ